jgi:hypothetical protein
MKIEKYSEFNDYQLNESFWQDVKYGLSKLGRYKAGGKIFGKKGTDDKSREEVKEIMKKESNKLLKQVHGEVLITAPEFPNDRRKVTFLRGVIMYGQLYDSLVAASQKSPDEEGYMAPDVVNSIIEDMRKVIKKFLDVDLKAVYTVMESKEDDINTNEITQLNESFDAILEEEEFLKKLTQLKDRAMDKLFGAKKGSDAPQKTTKGQSAKFQQTSGETNVDSERMKTLQSNKLPIILAGIGGALGALGWIAQTQWFKDLITTTVEHPAQFGEKTFTTTVENNLKVDPNGWSYTIQNNGFAEATGKSLNFNQPASNLSDAFKFYGGGDESKGIEAMSNFLGDKFRGASVENITQQLADPSNATVGDVFNKLEGTWGDGALMNQSGGAKSFIAKQVYTQTKRVLIKAGFTTTTTSVIGGKLVALAPVLMAAGISLVTAGALVKLLREKGQRQSRAKTLNDLLQSLELVPVNSKKEEDNDEIKSDSDKEIKSDSDKETKSVDKKSIYPLMIKNLKSLQSALISSSGVELPGEKSEIGGGDRLKQGDKVKVNRRKIQKVGESLVVEKTLGIQPRSVKVSDEETYLIDAVKNIRKSVKSLQNESDKGVSISDKFIGDILDKKLDSNSKEPITELYKDIYQYLYGDKSKTLSDFGPLYKESVDVISNKSKRQVVAEKIARFAKRSMQFEGEGFYSSLGEFGADLKEFNETLKPIMDYFKEELTNENTIYRFNNFKTKI